MSTLSLTDWAAIAQIVLMIATVTGVIFSIHLSVRAIREVQADRRLRQLPHLSFDHGGFKLPIQFIKTGRRIPGINPDYVEEAFKSMPEDAESIRINVTESKNGTVKGLFYGSLRNFGQGPALKTRVTYIPKSIEIGNDRFSLDKEKLNEPAYSRDLNSIPSSPSHINPGETAHISRLPTFIEKDWQKKISEAEGIIEISYSDIFNETHLSAQKVRIATYYKEDEPFIVITFGEAVDN